MSKSIVAIDFETANSDPCSACAIGLLVYQDGKVIYEYESLIKPPRKYSEFNYYNTKIHGIHRDEVIDEPRWDEIYPNIKPYLEDSIIIAHNAMFDLRVLKHLNSYYNIELPKAQYFCTVELSQKWLPDLENHKLNTVSDYLNVALDHHNAKSDARACLAIAANALNRFETNDISDVLNIVHMELKDLI